MFRSCLSFHLFLLCAAAACASEPAAPVKPEEPVPDTELLAKIEAMPDNTWLKLPPCKVIGDMGILNKDPDHKRVGPFVRDYCNKMVWAPERKRALYCGGGHNCNPYNDVWEYDLAANTWICLYGADPLPARFTPEKEAEGIAWYKEHAVVKDGVVRTPRGGPMRSCHTWWGLCYDPDLKRMLFLESHKGFFTVDKALLAKAHNLDLKDPMWQTYGSGPGDAWLFAFYPETREWKEVLTKVPKARESSAMEYITGSKTIFWASGKTFLYDASKKEWTPVGKDVVGAGETACDPESNKVVAVVGRDTWVFDGATNAWTQAVKDAPDGTMTPQGTFCYDTAAKKFVLYTTMQIKDKPDAGIRLWLYDLKENKWTQPAPEGECPKVGNIAGYYDAARNVTVIYANSQIWVYRCKKTSK